MGQLIPLILDSFSFVVGSFNASNYITLFDISIPLSQYNSALIWQGNFELQYNLAAKTAGLTPNSFSELFNPSIWRDGQQSVNVALQGYNLPILRITDYEWDEETYTGKGNLTQLIDLLNFERTGEEIPDSEFSEGTDINKIVKGLLKVAGNIKGTQIVGDAQIAIAGLDGKIDVKLVSKNGVNDAQLYVGSNGKFLYTNNSEVITVIDKPEYINPLFVRSLSQVFPVNNDKEQNFAADRIEVIGSKQVGKKNETDVQASPSDEFDDKGRPNFLRTYTIKPIGELFPDELPGDTREVVTEIKETFYRYKDRKQLYFNENDYVNLTPVVLNAIADYDDFISLLKEDDVIQTVTVQQQIIAEAFKGDLPDALQIPGLPRQPVRYSGEFEIPKYTNIPTAYFGFIISNLTIETEKYRWTFAPKGKKFSDFPFDFWFQKLPLVLDQKEQLITKLPSKTVLFSRIDPRTGKASLIEEQPEKEEIQLAPDYDYETATYKGVYELVPNGYNTFLPKTYQENFGFLPSQQWAEILARKIAIREIGRRDGKRYRMPLPLEWLASGCPLFSCVDIHQYRYIVENPRITVTVTDQGSQAYFSFFGELMGTLSTPIPEPPKYTPYIPTENLRILPVTVPVLRVE